MKTNSHKDNDDSATAPEMKQRITYITSSDDELGPSRLSTLKTEAKIQDLRAAKEHRITVDLSELPRELVDILELSAELNLRWTSQSPYTVVNPLASRLAPGLHLFVTPKVDALHQLICPSLKKLFGEIVKCDSSQDPFIAPATLGPDPSKLQIRQYYSILPSLHHLVQYMQLLTCPETDSCQVSINSLLSASFFDLDYESTSQTLVTTAFWDQAPTASGWTDNIIKANSKDRVEVGLLHAEQTEEQDEMSLGGWLTVLDDHVKSTSTLFSFPSRHHTLQSTTSSTNYTTSFDQPTGLHPILRITIPSSLPTPDESCTLHAYLILPSAVFLDRYAFTDALFLSSHNLHSLHSLSGVTDLEAPDWAVPQWGSAALFSLMPPRSTSSTHDITIPLHLRYLAPASGGYTDISMPDPVVFWACAGETADGVNPFDRTQLGYDTLFDSATVFKHLTASSSEKTLMQTITVPVLDLHERSVLLEWGTVGTVVLGFLWVAWCLVKPVTVHTEGQDDITKKGKKKI